MHKLVLAASATANYMNKTYNTGAYIIYMAYSDAKTHQTLPSKLSEALPR